MQVGSVAVGSAPEGVAVHPDGMLVYVANSGDRTISVVDTVFNRVIGVITLDEFGGAPQPLVPRGIACLLYTSGARCRRSAARQRSNRDNRRRPDAWDRDLVRQR